MTRNALHPALLNPFVLWTDLALRATEMTVSSGHVIGSRVERIVRAGANPSPRDLKEMALMSTEKVKAATESSFAVTQHVQAANVQLMARAWQQWWVSVGAMTALAGSRSISQSVVRQDRLRTALQRSHRTQSHLSSDAARMAGAALRPVQHAVSANARRLRRASRSGAAAPGR